jgi:ribonuclease-3
MDQDPAVVEAKVGHAFRDRDLLKRALTHKSLTFEQAAMPDNEQLEFLGDAILGFLVSEAVLAAHPEFPEGKLSKLKAQLVSASHLHQVARRLGLGEHLLLGHGEELSGGRQKKNLLSDAVEALIAAMYLDGGVSAARQFVSSQIIGDAINQDAAPDAGSDFKSALQEMAQTLGLPQPRYHVLEERGPEHSKTFVIEVRLGKEWVERAEGASKKSAGQSAAERLLGRLEPQSGNAGTS